ncbi:unnamed protein product [Choristocarpus tenellus]
MYLAGKRAVDGVIPEPSNVPSESLRNPSSRRSYRNIYDRKVRGGEELSSLSVKPSRSHQLWDFFGDFFESTPHPWSQLLLTVGWSVVVAVLNDGVILDAKIDLDQSAAGAIATILSFLIVFRTSKSIQRWYEGRTLWGKLSFSCIDLTQQSSIWIEDDILAQRIMQQSVAFAYAVKQHLRNEILHKNHLEGLVHPSEVNRINAQTTDAPLYCADVIRKCIMEGLTKHPQPSGQQAIARGIDSNISSMTCCFADLTRIKSCPQPAAYRTFLHFFIMFYLLLLPVESHSLIGYWIIPEVLFTSYLMLGLQLTASELEDPFGYDHHDIDVEELWQTIRKQCLESFKFGRKNRNNLTSFGEDMEASQS